MAAKKSQKRRHFTPEYKAEVVELFRKGGKTAGQSSRADQAASRGQDGPEETQSVTVGSLGLAASG